MSFEIMTLSSGLIQKQAVAELEKCNEFTAQFGLTLSNYDAVELVETRTLALKNNGRIEFGGGVIEKIIREFYNSPYLSMHNYAESLHDLTDMFYFYKNETLELMSDDDLIKFMKRKFDGICKGSLELLSGRELAKMARNVRFGYDPEHSEDCTSEENHEEDNDAEY
ncbi:DUF6323 family protein [Desulfosporosinus youngiae]|uniref:Uncharacterized protein n=1 Tax=Desulfosporosinus youngiae DSM 17734 TaxID=768710 RepID=H5Y5Z6_9FIRM|nr:DUF6323 family protein [Desulfosporosinus youngiae]EHQ90935.1 hypothetical protein DesyoDRAFT_3962 [Desulfosporosinus youngiae DSM 17734]